MDPFEMSLGSLVTTNEATENAVVDPEEYDNDDMDPFETNMNESSRRIESRRIRSARTSPATYSPAIKSPVSTSYFEKYADHIEPESDATFQKSADRSQQHTRTRAWISTLKPPPLE